MQRKAQGLAINLFTVNSEADMKRYISLGVDGIITDFPQRLERIRRDKREPGGGV